MNDRIPGVRVESQGRYERKCKNCPAIVVMARVDHGVHGRKWLALDPKPVTEDNGTLTFIAHRCPTQPSPDDNQRRMDL